eukprot:644320-Amphidinium_carterae.1
MQGHYTGSKRDVHVAQGSSKLARWARGPHGQKKRRQDEWHLSMVGPSCDSVDHLHVHATNAGPGWNSKSERT